ncbi:MAG: aminopeptidase [Candidatus Lokiarchaeota archaeon]|nr:aminopeptidase [Candidatus Lokiarchaeota archaeon]
MFNYSSAKLSKLILKHALHVPEKTPVLIMGNYHSLNLIRALYTDIIIIGSYPAVRLGFDGADEIFYKYANEDQLTRIPEFLKFAIDTYDYIIQIWADYNPKHLQLVDPQKLQMQQKNPEFPELMQKYMSKTWTLAPYPTQAMAQEAGMDLYSYADFVSKALMIDKDDPIAEWERIQLEQDRIVEILNKTDEIHVIGEDTDLTLSVKGRTWINCSGQKNLPDGEVFTGPVEDSVNGHIRFTYPGIYQGKEIENIYLEVKDGQVIKSTASKGQKLLDEVLKVPNADKFGEFAVGTNYGITKFTKNMLFDEKIGGTLHMALGMSIPESGGKNMSGIHWDILKDMKLPGSQIIADSTVVYEEGKWKI